MPATRQDKRSLSLVRHSTTDAVLHSKLINCDTIRVMQHRIRVIGSSDTLITQPDELVPFPTTPVPAAARSPAFVGIGRGPRARTVCCRAPLLGGVGPAAPLPGDRSFRDSGANFLRDFLQKNPCHPAAGRSGYYPLHRPRHPASRPPPRSPVAPSPPPWPSAAGAAPCHRRVLPATPLQSGRHVRHAPARPVRRGPSTPPPLRPQPARPWSTHPPRRRARHADGAGHPASARASGTLHPASAPLTAGPGVPTRNAHAARVTTATAPATPAPGRAPWILHPASVPLPACPGVPARHAHAAGLATAPATPAP
ncbi:basic proline-rich protein-like [Panicum virgatum]|uniref:basic proline-rich protein-like n=1 Tax=Panicum virgatum TaxID=38727 RepID=UPI0019D5940E|nr:basic proline-rich protein-like [Panicum virgatum]